MGLDADEGSQSAVNIDGVDDACQQAEAGGYRFIAYSADIADCDRFIKTLIAGHGACPRC